MDLALDHLVIAARTLGEGVAWCEATLGVRPETGGRHDFMRTHNRLVSLASPAFARSYLEIIAIDPDAQADPVRPARRRWFDLDDARLQRALAGGPQLVHWAARCDDLEAARAAFAHAHVDAGEVEEAQRETPDGWLRWRIALRGDGRRLLGGAVPVLIAWGERHPTDTLPASGVTLDSVRVGAWPDALTDLLPTPIERDAAPAAAPLSVTLSGRHGRVTLQANALEG